jgi:hypothetical protein
MRFSSIKAADERDIFEVQSRSFCGLAEETAMDKVRVAGSAKQVKGAVKEAVGKGSRRLQARGRGQS